MSTPPPGESGPTAALAAWVATSSVDDVPPAVLESARLLILDGLGCGLFGSAQPWSRIVAGFVTEGGGRPEASIWGTRHAVPLTGAPLANGTSMHAFEYDDLHPRAVLHAGAQVLPVAVAVAESVLGAPDQPTTDLSGRQLLHAITIGFEVGARIGLATGAGQLDRGFHPSPNTGTFAAAATAARLLGLDADRTRDALGIAGSFGGYLMAAQYGAMVKRVHPGHAAQSGLTAALLAARGLTGTRAVLEAPYGGFGSAYAGVDPEAMDSVCESLEEQWEVPEFSVKYYPCCGSNHTSLDAWWELRSRHPDLRAEDIERLDVACSTLTADHVGWSYRPDSVTTAQMNLSYCLAAAVVDDRLSVDQFATDRLADPEVLSVVDRVTVHAAPDIDDLGRARRHHVRLTATTRDGQTLQASAEHPRGSAANPLSPHEVMSKFDRLAGQVLPGGAVDELRDRVLALGTADERPGHVRRLTRLLGTDEPEQA